jgi:hypothetical protein
LRQLLRRWNLLPDLGHSGISLSTVINGYLGGRSAKPGAKKKIGALGEHAEMICTPARIIFHGAICSSKLLTVVAVVSWRNDDLPVVERCSCAAARESERTMDQKAQVVA